MMNFVLIDGSYFVFYRYFALNVWWKNAKSGDKPDVGISGEIIFTQDIKSLVLKTMSLVLASSLN